MATTAAEQPTSALFIDTNVLVYANVNEAPQHQAALAAIDQARKDGLAEQGQAPCRTRTGTFQKYPTTCQEFF